jgi:hypothetical protein
MQVTRYQMHNVLECYSKKLSRARGRETIAGGFPKKASDELTLSSDTSRVAAMNKISRQVLDKVMDVVALSSAGKTGRHPMNEAEAGAEGGGETLPIEFTYRMGDSINLKSNIPSALGDPEE